MSNRTKLLKRTTRFYSLLSRKKQEEEVQELWYICTLVFQFDFSRLQEHTSEEIQTPNTWFSMAEVSRQTRKHVEANINCNGNFAGFWLCRCFQMRINYRLNGFLSQTNSSAQKIRLCIACIIRCILGLLRNFLPVNWIDAKKTSTYTIIFIY